MKISGQVEGADEILKTLRTLPEVAQKRVYRTSLAAGGRVFAKQVRANAARDTGRLRRNIVVKAINPFLAMVLVRTRGKASDPKNAFYFRFLERGTSRMPAQPFIRPAYDSQKSNAKEAVRERMKQRIEAEIARLRGR